MNDTIVAISTTMGVGAISIVRLSGNKAISIVNKSFKGKNLEEVENNENTVIIEVPSEPAIDNGTDDAYVSKEPVIDKSSDYWKFIDTPLINVDFTELINLNSGVPNIFLTCKAI